MTSRGSRSAIGSPEAVSGQLPLALPDGGTTARSGQHPARASRSARPAKVPELMIQGICGRTYIESFAGPENEGSDLLFSWESRLRERLATIGSTESALIWRRKDIAPGLSISRLAVSTPLTNGTGSIGRHWPTAQARDGMPPHSEEYIAAKKAEGHGMANLNDHMALTAQWGTVRLQANGNLDRSTDGKARLEDQIYGANWSTPRASDGEKGGPNQSFGAGCQPLPAQMHQASPSVTPSARDWKDTPGMATEAGDRSRLDQLPRQMAATWVTVQAADGNKGSLPPRPHDTGISLPQHMAATVIATWPTIAAHLSGDTAEAHEARQARMKERHGRRMGTPLNVVMEHAALGTTIEALTGPTPNGSSATTGKPGVPNPVFAFWLMGFPEEFISGALAAMQSFRSSRKKSSAR